MGFVIASSQVKLLKIKGISSSAGLTFEVLVVILKPLPMCTPIEPGRRRKRIPWRTALVPALLLVGLVSTSCIKSTRVVHVPERKQQARSLSRSELAKLLEERAAAVQSLQASSVKAYVVAGDPDLGKEERYRGAPGYVLAQRPNYLRITIQNPLTKTSLADLVSDGTEVKMWIPRLNKFFVGSTNISRIDYPSANENPLANVRPQHILPALLFTSPLSRSTDQVFLEEDSDASANYYVVGVLEMGLDSGPLLSRRIWIERSKLQVTREKYYAGDGKVAAAINYLQYQNIDGQPVAVKIKLQRYAEHYSMTLELDRVKLNPSLQAGAFQLNKIPSAELVLLKEGRP